MCEFSLRRNTVSSHNVTEVKSGFPNMMLISTYVYICYIHKPGCVGVCSYRDSSWLR